MVLFGTSSTLTGLRPYRGKPVRCEMQQLLARKLLAHPNLDAQVEPNQMKHGLAEINASSVRLLYPNCVKAADHPISYVPVCRGLAGFRN